MTFDVSAQAYGRFMGRFSEPLAKRFTELLDVRGEQRALDVGCGPGALTAELVRRLGAGAVSAVDPSESFVAAIQERLPGVDVRRARAEQLPFDVDSFDLTLAQLVVHFMSDPVAGLREMGRVTRGGGVVGASVWDHAGGGSPLSPFWQAVHELDPHAEGEATLPGAKEGHLAQLGEAAGLREIQTGSLTVQVTFARFDDWWDPFRYGVGPAGSYVSTLDPSGVDALQEHLRSRLSDGPFEVAGTAWYVLAKP